VLGGIETLLNNSLLREEEGANGQTRLRMLETIREYALEQLGRSEDLNAFRAAHAQYYFTKIAQDIGFNLFTDQSIMWLDWLEAEHDNIRAALAWGQNAPIPGDLATAINQVLGWFWYRRGYLTEGLHWADSFLKASTAAPGTAERAHQLMSTGMLALWQGDAKTAVTRLTESAEIMTRLEDDMMTPLVLSGLGIVHINMGNDAAAIPLLMQCAHALKPGPENDLGVNSSAVLFFYATSLVHLGNAALGSGKPAEAREWLDKAYPVAVQSGDPWTVSFALNNLGEVARVQGDYAKARSYYEESETLLRSMGDHGDLARLVHNLGYIALHEGKPDKARAQFAESLAMFRKLGNKRGLAECTMAFSALKAVEERHEESARLFSAAETLLSDSGVAWWPADRTEVERTRATLQSVLNAAELNAAFEAGRGMSLDDVFLSAQ
jgi:tetratricopeptide (TPR) repeat protein